MEASKNPLPLCEGKVATLEAVLRATTEQAWDQDIITDFKVQKEKLTTYVVYRNLVAG